MQNTTPLVKLAAFALIASILTLASCSRSREDKDNKALENDTLNDLRADQAQPEALVLGTQPRTVLLTGLPQYRLTPVLKLNWDPDARTTFVSGVDTRSEYREDEIGVNVWHEHIVPGYEAACAYNMVNVSHFDMQTRQQRQLFDSLVLVKTLYFPTTDPDTLKGQPIRRNCYMVSVFDEDTNHDGFVNQRDLRRFYHFALPSLEKTPLVPKNHSVYSSEYDLDNDLMYVFTREDANKTGNVDEKDGWHVFWIDMKDPKINGLMY